MFRGGSKQRKNPEPEGQNQEEQAGNEFHLVIKNPKREGRKALSGSETRTKLPARKLILKE